MINSKFFLGYPSDFQGICNVFPPKIKDILNEKNYPVYKKLLLSSQEDIEDEYAELKLSMEDVPTPEAPPIKMINGFLESLRDLQFLYFIAILESTFSK